MVAITGIVPSIPSYPATRGKGPWNESRQDKGSSDNKIMGSGNVPRFVFVVMSVITRQC